MMRINAVLFCLIPWIVTGIAIILEDKTVVPYAAFVILLIFPPAVLMALFVAYNEGRLDEVERNKEKKNATSDSKRP